uniref:3-methyl-2-oxobutanoate hydroxymethyltransferase n=1 Tax=Glossina austeni TaxID=7395 RepID=A0A1A9UKG6_GLOAU
MQKNKKLPSTLYIVPTPIGNLTDITYRAVSVLRYVDIIAAESIFYAKILLKYFLIKNRLMSLNKINEKNKTKLIIHDLKDGKSIALISNAGTPTISDPGYYLIHMCIKNQINIVPLPGPCSLITALSVSGVVANKFCYDGFLPRKKSERIAYLRSLKFENRAVVLFESSRRLIISLQDISNILDALKNSAKLIQAGANMVKLEGGLQILDTIYQLNANSIPVCGHIGLTPQSINICGSYKIQGKNKTETKRLINEAILLEQSGVKILVLECIVQNLSNIITKKLKIPTIGIGSGPHTDGQILVMHDVLGITCGKIPSFAKNFFLNNPGISEAIKLYVNETENERFPGTQHSFN